MQIAITYLKNASDAEAIVQKLKAYGATAVAIKADVADLAAAPSVIEQALSALDATELDILGVWHHFRHKDHC